MPAVSILLPYHNAAATIDGAVASMAAQSFTHWELLLIDNTGSSPVQVPPDESRSIAQRWADRDPRITLLHEPRIGIAHALNTGLAHATGNYIARMDADDMSHPERLAKQVAYLDAHPEIGVLSTRTAFASSMQESRGMQAFVDWQNAILTPHAHYVKRFVDAPIAHPTVMFRRELVDQHGGYDTGPLPEDHELWLRWMDAGVRFAKLPEELLTWNDHAGRLSRTHPNYSVDAFFTTKAKWLARWMKRSLNGRPVIIAGTSTLCRDRAAKLEAEGITISAFTDVKAREVPGYAFIPHEQLLPVGEAFIVSFISQRGTGDRIAEFLASRGLVEGVDFVLAA
ncbi:MAG: glycosyltransferase [Flavobacteriales bacterium]|nr:glycosyltransferase [Flavobacteriales bacterium]